MTSPMTAASLHDTLVLLDGTKRWPVPGVSRVSVSLNANVDVQVTPAAGKAVTQLNEAAAEIDVQVTMWTDAQWTAYQDLLAVLRRGTKTGPAVFQSPHPEIRARRVRQMYFVSEQAQPYNPREGYRVALKFSEKLKDKASTQVLGETTVVVPGSGSGATFGGAGGGTTQEAAVLQAAQQAYFPPGVPVDGGRATSTQGGYCSAWQRIVWTKAGGDPALFGGTALATEANFRRAGLTVPWNGDVKSLRPGQLVFYGKDPSGSGHVGTYMGLDANGVPQVMSNNLVTYAQKHGGFDAGGRPIDKSINAVGVVPLLTLGTPTSIGLPGGAPRVPVTSGTTASPPPNRPSANVPGPR